MVIAERLDPLPMLSDAKPLLGHLAELRRDRLGFFRRGLAAHPRGFRYSFGGAVAVCLNDPELIKAVLVDQAEDFEKGIFGSGLEPLIGQGLLTARNEPHRRVRKLVAPAFHHHRVASYAAVMSEYAEDAACGWADGGVIDLSHEMTALTLRIVAKTLFDADVRDEATSVGEALSGAVEFVTNRQLSMIRLPLALPTPAHRKFRDAVGLLDATLYRVIAARRKSGEDTGDLLSMLLRSQDEQNGAGLSDQQVRDEAMTLFLAGHETTANAMTWAFHLLSRNRQVWLKLREEVVRVLGGRRPELADLPNLPYALQVFKETLRLYPSAYIFGREAVRDVRLLDVHIPRKAVVSVSVYAMHRDPSRFPNPDVFDPERWTPTHEAKLHRYAYLPFGGGARQCIGNQFALMEGQLILASVAQRVKLESLNPTLDPDPQVTLRPKGKVPAKVTRL
jgi:cytochrome P450